MRTASWGSVLVALTMTVAACGGQDAAQPAPAPAPAPTPDAPGPECTDRTTIRIGTSSAAGTFYAMAAGLADVLNREGCFNATAQTTPGSSAPNVSMLATGDIQLGYVTTDQAFEGFAGQRVFANPQPGMRAVAAGNIAEIQLVASASSGVTSVADLQGRRIGAGAPGSLTEKSLTAILTAAGVTEWTPVYGSNRDNLDSLRDGTVDAVNTPLGAPSPGLTEVESVVDLVWLSLSDEDIATVNANHPYWAPVSIQPGVYTSLDFEYKTVGYPTVIVTQEAVSADAIYDILTLLYANQPTLVNVHPAFRQ